MDNTEVVAAPIDQHKVNADDGAIATVDTANQNSRATVTVNGDGSATDTSDAILEPECSDIDNGNVADDDNHSNQDSDADYTEFLEDVFMQVPPPENITWPDIIERRVSDVEDENSEGGFAVFMDALNSEEDPDVTAKRTKFAGFVAFVQTPDTLTNTDFLTPSGEDDENSVEKAWEEIVSGMAPPEEAASLLTWALSWFNPAAWYQQQPVEVTLEKKGKEVDPADELMSETDCASEVSSQAIMQMQMV